MTAESNKFSGEDFVASPRSFYQIAGRCIAYLNLGCNQGGEHCIELRQRVVVNMVCMTIISTRATRCSELYDFVCKKLRGQRIVCCRLAFPSRPGLLADTVSTLPVRSRRLSLSAESNDGLRIELVIKKKDFVIVVGFFTFAIRYSDKHDWVTCLLRFHLEPGRFTWYLQNGNGLLFGTDCAEAI